MIMGDVCTRHCPFCNVAHGSPDVPAADEPVNLARAVEILKLSYVVITSVTRWTTFQTVAPAITGPVSGAARPEAESED